MKVIGLLATALVTVAGWYIGQEWLMRPFPLPRIFALLLLLVGGIVFYFGSAFARSRCALLSVGRLESDPRINASVFQVKVRNLGPGVVKPVVKITYLRDAKGGYLPKESSYLASEVYWRYSKEADWRPSLAERDEAYAELIYATDTETENPTLVIHLINSKFIYLWSDPIPLDKQSGLRLRFTASYEGTGRSYEPLVVERSYLIKPDKRQAFKYKAKRVRFRSLFWN